MCVCASKTQPVGFLWTSQVLVFKGRSDSIEQMTSSKLVHYNHIVTFNHRLTETGVT